MPTDNVSKLPKMKSGMRSGKRSRHGEDAGATSRYDSDTDGVLPPNVRGRLNELFGQIEKEFEILYAENLTLQERVEALTERLETCSSDKLTIPENPDTPDIGVNKPKRSASQISQKIKTTYKASTSKIVSSFRYPSSIYSVVKEYRGHRDGVWEVSCSRTEKQPPAQPKSPDATPGSALRQRTNIPSGKLSSGIRAQPITPRPSGATSPRMSTPNVPRQGSARMQPRMLLTPQHNGRTPRPPLPRPLLPRERTKTDRLLEYLLGDGPQNRYALICKFCHSHNGMAMKEEFEFISFRCCYCYQMNPAKKYRPYAPKLETTPAVPTPSSNTQKKSGSTEEMDEEDENDDEDDGDDDTDGVDSSDTSGNGIEPESQSDRNTQQMDEATNSQLKTMTKADDRTSDNSAPVQTDSSQPESNQMNSDLINSEKRNTNETNSDQQVSTLPEAAEKL